MSWYDYSMTREETWKQLIRTGVVKGRMPRKNEWNLVGANLAGANLFLADLSDANLARVNLACADLGGADLLGVNLSGANLSGANLYRANLTGARLFKANLSEANLSVANLSVANLSGADLSGADLDRAALVQANLQKAKLNNCLVYGISAWDLSLEGAEQSNLTITKLGQRPAIVVDNLKIAQFIYLLLSNPEIREVIDAITSKVVLILGRFGKSKPILNAIRTELRHRGSVPVLFDFEKPRSKDTTGTVETLARMARFIIADITYPRSVPHELATIVPFLRTTPVLPLQLKGSNTYDMFNDLRRYPWVLPTHEYHDKDSLIESLKIIIAPADEMAERLRKP